MIKDKFGQLIFNESDICNMLMSGQELTNTDKMLVDQSVNLEEAAWVLDHVPVFVQDVPQAFNSVEDFDRNLQSRWNMPDEYKTLDIAEHVLSLCTTQEQLQRVGEELLLYQERDLFNLLRFLKYLVDVMTKHQLIWGVGRGSSVASYVLYLLKVHRVDSMYYDLDIGEFLR